MKFSTGLFAIVVLLAGFVGDDSAPRVPSLVEADGTNEPDPSGSPTSRATPPESGSGGGLVNTDAELAFARCMRARGIDFKDPTFGPDGFPIGGGVEVDDIDPGAFDRASRECRASGISLELQFTEGQRAAWVHAAFIVARCMRENGFPMPDPRPDPTSPTGYALDTGFPGEVDPHTVPSYRRANDRCNYLWLTFAELARVGQ